MPRPIWTGKEISIACFLVLLTLAVYLPVFWLGFTNYDDPDYVTENFRISKGLTFSGIVWAFTAAHSGNWHPLTWISHMLDCQLFDLHAWGHHFSNLCFHLANIVLLFAWLRNFTGAVWRSAAVAALFALHPMHVESVAWVAERKDVMSGFFGLLSLYVYGLYAVANSNHSNVADVQRVMGLPKSGYYWLSLLIFIAGLMSKSMLVTWPFLMILVDLWPLQRLDLRERFSANRFVMMEKVPFLFCSFIVCLVTLATQHQARAMASLHDVSLPRRLLKIFPAYLAYLQKLLWPKDLAVIYPDPGSYPPATLLAGLAIFCAITFLVWSVRARKPFILMGWMWFVGTLVPVIGLVKVGDQSIADRYSYLPSIGFFIMCVWGVRELIRTRFSKIIGSAAIAIIIFGWYTIQTPSQILLWMNTETFFRHALRVTQNNFVAYNSLAFYLADLGESRQAEQLLRVSLQINSLSAVAWNKLGSVLINAEITLAPSYNVKEHCNSIPHCLMHTLRWPWLCSRVAIPKGRPSIIFRH